jgi:hypothetical protein
MPPSRAELVRWCKRFETVERIDTESAARAAALSPARNLDRALGLSVLATAAGTTRQTRPDAEDLHAYRKWARLRAPYVRRSAP